MEPGRGSDGFVLIHRKILDNPVFHDADLLKLFLYLLLQARWADGFVHGVPVKRGQYLTGRKALADALKQRERSVYDRLLKLARLGICNIETNNRYSIVTILNYDTYQNYGIETQQQTQQQPNNNPTHQIKGKEEEEREREPARALTDLVEEVPARPPPAKRKRMTADLTMCPEDFEVTDALRAFCLERRLPDPQGQRDLFVNYWRGRGELRADWTACFRTWMLKTKEIRNGNAPPQPGRPQARRESVHEYNARLDRERAERRRRPPGDDRGPDLQDAQIL